MVTPERGLLLLPTTPAMYPATAENRKPAVKIITRDRIAGSNSPEISHTMKNIGTAIAMLVIATDFAGKSWSVLTIFFSLTASFVASNISVIPLMRASRITTNVYKPPTSIVPTPAIRLRSFICEA